MNNNSQIRFNLFCALAFTLVASTLGFFHTQSVPVEAKCEVRKGHRGRQITVLEVSATKVPYRISFNIKKDEIILMEETMLPSRRPWGMASLVDVPPGEELTIEFTSATSPLLKIKRGLICK